MNIPWWTCPSCFVSHPDKTASTESGASLLQAPDSRLQILGVPKYIKYTKTTLSKLNLCCTLLIQDSFQCIHPLLPEQNYFSFSVVCSQYKFTCSPAPSLPSLLPELILLLSPWTRSVRQVSSHLRFCPDCTYYCPFPSILSKYHPLSFPDSASHLRCDFGTLLLVLTKMSWSLLNAR